MREVPCTASLGGQATWTTPWQHDGGRLALAGSPTRAGPEPQSPSPGQNPLLCHACESARRQRSMPFAAALDFCRGGERPIALPRWWSGGIGRWVIGIETMVAPTIRYQFSSAIEQTGLS